MGNSTPTPTPINTPTALDLNYFYSYSYSPVLSTPTLILTPTTPASTFIQLNSETLRAS